MRRATSGAMVSKLSIRFQSTLSVRRATNNSDVNHLKEGISIHALREESDFFSPYCQNLCTNFNPRSPWGERRYVTSRELCSCKISIHALREESDHWQQCKASWRITDFNPRSPWGERLACLVATSVFGTNFNPRSPWGERPIPFLPWLLYG